MDTKTVSLVLGSGGARGLAHIGVLRWLDESGYTVRAISGSSMGALIGGIYACGRLDAYREWVCSLEMMDVIRLLDFSYSREGLFKGDRVINTLKKLIGDCNIEDLPISYTAVATELYSGKETWLNSGSLFDAIRASIAIPSVMTPYKIGDKLYIDGAVSNPLPIAPTLNDFTDLTVAVNVSAKAQANGAAPIPATATPPSKDAGNPYRRKIAEFIGNLQRRTPVQAPAVTATEKLNMLDVMTRALDTTQHIITRFQLASYSPDIVIEIPRNASGFYEFHRAHELIDIGYRRAATLLGGRG